MYIYVFSFRILAHNLKCLHEPSIIKENANTGIIRKLSFLRHLSLSEWMISVNVSSRKTW